MQNNIDKLIGERDGLESELRNLREKLRGEQTQFRREIMDKDRTITKLKL